MFKIKESEWISFFVVEGDLRPGPGASNFSSLVSIRRRLSINPFPCGGSATASGKWTSLFPSFVSSWQRWAKWRLSTFDLYPGGEGHGVQGQICDILRPQLAMNWFLPLWPHRYTHFGYIHLGALILDRCRAFDLFASVDAHLCLMEKSFCVGNLSSAMGCRAGPYCRAGSVTTQW